MTTHIPRRTRILAWLAVAAAVAACSDISAGDPLVMTLSAEATSVPAGKPLVVNYTVTGTFIVGIVVTYGDGLVDSVPAGSSRSAFGHMSHTWQSAGEYDVVATAFDESKGTISKALMIHVTEPTAAPAGY